MKLMVDECVDWRLLRDLHAYDAKTVKQAGWEHVDDSTLLRLAAAEFDAFLTVDKDLPHQQNITSLDIAVVVLRARTTRLADLRELLGLLHNTLEMPESGVVKILNWRDLA